MRHTPGQSCIGFMQASHYTTHVFRQGGMNYACMHTHIITCMKKGDMQICSQCTCMTMLKAVSVCCPKTRFYAFQSYHHSHVDFDCAQLNCHGNPICDNLIPVNFCFEPSVGGALRPTETQEGQKELSENLIFIVSVCVKDVGNGSHRKRIHF